MADKEDAGASVAVRPERVDEVGSDLRLEVRPHAVPDEAV
jgi:hypothetical protein